ncbi:uncharacterized protein LOC112898508 isoform X2 [Panicum hallii]|uniref:uncharacterized protein LOC112898508 isoform X2 n=1 Tax=Panicum hallii TaxID=206008 RepID=UPI000DF4EE5F|nr:uncharacterized protein LOC112898508 isoform X2 [Panicum hallii]
MRRAPLPQRDPATQSVEACGRGYTRGGSRAPFRHSPAPSTDPLDPASSAPQEVRPPQHGGLRRGCLHQRIGGRTPLLGWHQSCRRHWPQHAEIRQQHGGAVTPEICSMERQPSDPISDGSRSSLGIEIIEHQQHCPWHPRCCLVMSNNELSPLAIL